MMPTTYIARSDPRFPSILSKYEGMPSGLYVRGAIPDCSIPTVAIVGSRACSAYGKRQAIHFAKTLAEHGVCIVSGLAHGIDAWAHFGALEGGGTTIAVLGCGADICYPKENFKLYSRILESGSCILSEFEDGTKPAPWHFPIRNRIISALSDLVLVVEARSKSGSLITADYALEQGKNIFVIPGRLEDDRSAGCNELIAQGAGIATSPELLLEVLGVTEQKLTSHFYAPRVGGWTSIPKGKSQSFVASGKSVEKRMQELDTNEMLPESSNEPAAELTEEEKNAEVIRRVLLESPASLDTLLQQTGMELQKLSALLLEMQLNDEVQVDFGGFYTIGYDGQKRRWKKN